MKVEKIEPKIVTYKLTLDKKDEEYTSCMWARFILDYDTWRLTINSDAGDYTYHWGKNDNDDFTSLMAKVNEDYLLGKMSNKNRIFIDRSKKAMIQTIEKDGWNCFGIDSEEEWEEVKQDIMNDIDDCSSEESFYRAIEFIVPEIDFECIEIIKDYPHGAYVAIGLFIKYIQPILKEGIL